MLTTRHPDPIDIRELAKTSGKAEELPARERARFALAGWVLVGLVVLVGLSGLVLIYGPAGRLTEATEVFDFVSTMAPPIATLVISFYFHRPGE